MSTDGPMSQEQLDAIQARVNTIRARVDAITGNYSWPNYPWPDPTSERIKGLEKGNAELRKRLTVDDAMVERPGQPGTPSAPSTKPPEGGNQTKERLR